MKRQDEPVYNPLQFLINHQMQIEYSGVSMGSKIAVVVLVFTLAGFASAVDVPTKSDRSEFKKSLAKNCDDSYSLTCLKLDVVSWVDKLSENEDISVLPGVSIVRENSSAKVTTSDIVTELAREFPDDPNARLDAFMLKKVSGFLNNHSIKLNLWNAAQDESAGTARKKDKKGGDGMGMILAAGAMMKGMLMALALGGIAALAGKALMTGLISLLLSAIIGLKSLSGGGGGHSTYEVVAKPIYSTSHSHSTSHEGGGWDGGYGGHGRSLGDAPIIPGVTMVTSKSVKVQNNDIALDAARQFPEDADSRTNQYLLRKLENFLDSHSLNVNLSMVLNDQSEVSARAKDKKGGDTKTILTTGIMIVAVFTQLALWGLAVLGGKALIISAISLLFSGILGIKELTSKENVHVAQAAPHRASEGWESYSGHSRSSNFITPVEDLENHLISWIERLNNHTGSFTVYPGVEIIQENSVDLEGKSSSEDLNANSNSLLKKSETFLKTHTIKLNLWTAAEALAGETSRSKKKKRGIGYGVMLAGAGMVFLMTSTFIAGVINLVAVKALILGTIALVIASFLGAKPTEYSHSQFFITAMWPPVLLCLLLVAAPVLSEESKYEFKKSFSKNCDSSYTLTCFKLDVVSWVEKLNEEDSYNLLPGVSLVRENDTSKATTADTVADLAREFPNDPESRLDVFLMRKVSKFMNNHSIKLKLWSENSIDGATARGGGGGGGGGGKGSKGGGGGGMGYLLAAGAMMKGTLMAIALGALAALAGKALMAALLSLVLSAIAALKGSGGGGGKTTYEVVAKPVYSQSHSHSSAHEDYGGGHSGYGRSFDHQPLPLGLQPDYKPGK
ncbi:hypothetical protein D910_03725 [Dendroctonus ponderosae]|uniref:Osiris 16 n=1 Tax=Dendroctonus ponderosae TaxID=77166 RepID=U4TZR5_DENPD|nr:hypothetical protein D910_03725 [Dendroctonus ponderosae]